MRISRIKIKNFANFSNLEIATSDNIVIVGENKVGKSNLIFALQLILDPGLSERDRELGLEHFWDGLGDRKLGETVEIVVELTDYEDDARLMAHLAECIVEPGPPMVSRLTYRFQPKAGLEGVPLGPADYEYIIFGGLEPDNSMRSSVRRMLPIDVLGALRDAERDLATWRRSPLRPLIQALTGKLDEDARAEIQEQADAARKQLAERVEVKSVAETISTRLTAMVGPQHATPISLGLAPSRIDALLRALGILIDDGSRGIGEASLGTANLIFLALKTLELDQLVVDGDRDHTFLAVEEPEAHLHPHVQRLVYRYLLNRPGAGDGGEAPSRLTTILTTHSPHIASVAPLRSILLLRHDATIGATVGVSTALTPLEDDDLADLQRYIDVTRGELLFARGVILVEGDAERFLIPAFADALEMPLDVHGITVCSVAGTNFAPYVKLLGPAGLRIPHVVLTDLDPVENRPPLAQRRVRGLLEIIAPGEDHAALNERQLFRRGEAAGYFVNTSTLEPTLFASGLAEDMRAVLLDELLLGGPTKDALQGWVDDPDTLAVEKFMRLIDRVGKGRFAQRLAPKVAMETCPSYIRGALAKIRDAVS